MQTNTQLYCLQTMGINPWVLRDKPNIILLFDSINFTEAERIFLDKMLSSVGLDSTQVRIQLFSDELSKQAKAVKLMHPTYLLAHPIEKKAAYMTLGALIA
jgi:hypothetical protein